MKTSSVLSIILCASYLSVFYICNAECAAVEARQTAHNPIVYRRYVRRRPSVQPGDQYVEEYVEIFNTQHKPPPITNPLTDEDIDRFIFCDFNRERNECKEYWDGRNHIRPMERPGGLENPTTQTPETVVPVEATTANVTQAPPSKTISISSTTTRPAATPTATTSTTKRADQDLFRIPDIPFDANEDAKNSFIGRNGDANDEWNDEDEDYADEEDQYDQVENATTQKSRFSLFGL